MQSSPRKLVDTCPPDRYETPPLLRTDFVLQPPGETGQLRILLVLEGGYELEVSVTPASRGEFYQKEFQAVFPENLEDFEEARRLLGEVVRDYGNGSP